MKLKQIGIILGLFIVGILIGKFVFLGSFNIEQQRKYAHLLVDKGLYEQAIAEYKKIVDSGKLSVKEEANLAYIMANIYVDNIHDYSNALALYLKVKILSADKELKQKVETRTIECLEKLGRPLEAQQEMEKATALKPAKEISKGAVVAKIRNREITMEELTAKLRKLPPSMQEAFKDKKQQLEFLKQYIAGELLYDSAKRRNFNNDKEIIDRAYEMKKALMVEKLLSEEVRSKIGISESDMKLYYETHKKDFTGKKDKKQKSYEEVKEEIRQTLQYEKEREKSQEYLENLLRVEQVTIYDDLFRN